MAVGLVDSGADVRVVTPSTAAAGVPARERWQGVDIHRHAYPGVAWPATRLTGGDGMWQRLRARPARAIVAPGLIAAMASALRSALRERSADVVIGHWLLPTAVALRTALLASGGPKPRALYVGHGSDVHLLRRLPGARVLLRALEATGTVCSTSPYLTDQLRLAGGRRIAWTPLGVAPPAVGPEASRRQPRVGGSLVLGVLGRLVPGKGVERALAVVAALPKASLLIAGDGGGRAEIEATIHSRALSARCLGPVVGADKESFFAEIDLLLYLADPRPPGAFQDNLPVGVVEALMRGIPVVATAVGELPSLLARGGGIVVPPNAAAIAGRIASLGQADWVALATEAVEAVAHHKMAAALDRLAAASRGAA